MLSSSELSVIIEQVQDTRYELANGSYGSSFVAFTDGSCRPAPGETNGNGGWGIVLFAPRGEKWELQGRLPTTTSNRAELCALIAALVCLPEESRLSLQSDSQYLVDGIRRFCRGTDHPDLWCEARELIVAKRIEVYSAWIAGHRGHPHNGRADTLASDGIRNSARRRRQSRSSGRSTADQMAMQAIGASVGTT